MSNTGRSLLYYELQALILIAGSFALYGAKGCYPSSAAATPYCTSHIIIVPKDSTIAFKLRAAGVIILGKSNLSQWANFRSLNSTDGWSAYGGQVFGAYYPGQNPSGSSSGSGVASSIGLALAALGTEVGFGAHI